MTRSAKSRIEASTRSCGTSPPAFIHNYGGRSLHAQSHREAFLAVLLNRMRSGLLILDEPESASSPQRQLAPLTRLAQLIAAAPSSSSRRRV